MSRSILLLAIVCLAGCKETTRELAELELKTAIETCDKFGAKPHILFRHSGRIESFTCVPKEEENGTSTENEHIESPLRPQVKEVSDGSKGPTATDES